MKRQLCLNGIVKNEAARMVRMLDSVKPYISTFAILDTGSTDNTVEVIREWGIANEINGTVDNGSFTDFSQARNDALDLARDWWKNPNAPKFSYLLLCDADMQLVVEDETAFDHLTLPAYEMVQKAGGMSYNNVRIVHVGPSFKYIGVTHEYLDCGGCGVLVGAHFVDHADGANRPEKYERDIRLLKADLERDPDNPRSWYYLANTYRDAGDYVSALAAYRKRLALGGWDEEVWNTQVNIANCFEPAEGKATSDEAAYIEAAIEAYRMRPQRTEPLHALAKHYRAKGANEVACIYAAAGLNVRRPGDRLFVEDWVYDWGFHEEMAIAGFYVERHRAQALASTKFLATSTKVPWSSRQHARNNMAFWLKPLKEICPSAKHQEIEFSTEIGYTAMNPSITNTPDGELEMLIRTVNYKINDAGQYMIGATGCWDAPIVTKNQLVRVTKTLAVRTPHEVLWDRPPVKFDKVIGLEDMRLFYRGGKRHFNACVREQSEWGQCEQWEGELHSSGIVTDAKRISDPHSTEKNWIWWHGDAYVYRLDKLIDHLQIRKVERSPFAVDNISGGSQWIDAFQGRVSVVHESLTHPHTGKRVYQHRFVWLSNDFEEMKVSEPFVFHEVQIEFCAGIARHPGGFFVLSYGVRDAEAWLCTVTTGDVRCALGL